MEADDALELDDLLRAAVTEQAPMKFSAEDRAEAGERSREAIAALRAERRTRREAFQSRKGRVVLTASASQPFQIAAFDPMNMHHLGGGEVLHTRMLKLRGQGIELEVWDAEALTEGVGSQPLFDGITRVTFTGVDNGNDG